MIPDTAPNNKEVSGMNAYTVLWCPVEKTFTRHDASPSGDWYCACGLSKGAEPEEEILEGSDNTLNGSLHEAGFGSGGVM